MNFTFDSIREWLIAKFYDITGSTRKLFRVGEYAQLLSLVSYMHELYTIYVETIFRELDWGSAQKRSSLARQAFPAYNYIPHRKKGATDFISISIDPTFVSATPITYTEGNASIPRWTSISDTDGTVNFYTTESGQYLNGTVAVTKNIDASSTPLNLGSGLVGIPATAHGFSAGEDIVIQGTANYDGAWNVNSATTTDTLVIETIYNLETFVGATITSGLVDIPIKEGTPKTYFYTAIGDASETFKILDDSIENDEIEVLIVDADKNTLSTVEIVETLYFENDTSVYKCEVWNSPDFDYIELRFGDGVKSKKLSSGEYVLVKFARTNGSLGNLDSTNTLTKFVDPVLDLNGNAVTLYATNRNTISGGLDWEDIESIRFNAPRTYNIAENASNSNAWETILNLNALILKSKVWSDYDVGDVSSNNNIVHIAAISTIGTVLTNDQQTIVGDYLKQVKAVTEIIRFEPLELIHSRFYIDGGIQNVSIASVESDISDILLEEFSVVTREFNENIYSLNAAALIRQEIIPNMVYYTFEIKHCEKSEVFSDLTEAIVAREIIVSNPSAVEPDAEHQVYLQEFSVEVWLKLKVAGVIQDEVRAAYTDPGDSSAFLGDNGYTISGSGIFYTTNIVDVTITNPPAGVLNPNDSQDDGYWVRLVYKTENGNGEFLNDIRLPQNYQITNCVEDDIIFNLHIEA